jgi:putative endonuclease
VGQRGEDVAVAHLAGAGFQILGRNLRSRLGELDVLAREGATLVFVEVKTRRAGAADPPQAAVDARKRERLERLALRYLASRGLGGVRCRFDVIAVTVGADARAAPRVVHFRNAFEATGWAG